MQERAFDLFTFLFSFGYLRGDTPILKASFAVGVRVRPEGERGACLMIIFHQFFFPDLYYYPTSSNLTEITRAHHQSEILPPPSLGGARRWSEPKKKRRREREGKRRDSLRASGSGEPRGGQQL